MILITNANSFLGRNLVCFLEQMQYTVIALSKDCSIEQLTNALKHSDFIINLLGIDFVATLIGLMQSQNIQSPLLTVSDATHLNDKWNMECELLNYAKKNQTKAFIARLPLVFGKWGKQLKLEDLPTDKTLNLMHIDDVLSIFLNVIQNAPERDSGYVVLKPIYTISADELKATLTTFSENTKNIPNLNDTFIYKLYTSYLSYLTPDELSELSPIQSDIITLMQSPPFGYFYLLTIKAGDTYGHHWHHTKVEKYIILTGSATMSLRSVINDTLYTYQLSSANSVTVPPAYAHKITNTGDSDLTILLWSSDLLDNDTFLEII